MTERSGMSRRRALMIGGLAMAVPLLTAMPPASASDLELVVSRTVTVRESDALVDAHIQVNQGDRLIFHADGQIWAGVWFTGLNGPDGWTNIDNDPKFPLPGTHPYCLLGVLDNGPFFVGSNYRIDHTGDQGELFLEINDDVHGNGSGAFTCFIEQYRST